MLKEQSQDITQMVLTKYRGIGPGLDLFSLFTRENRKKDRQQLFKKICYKIMIKKEEEMMSKTMNMQKIVFLTGK